MAIIRHETELLGKKLIIESGRMANLADGSVTLRWGDAMILATACLARTVREGTDFLPLTIEYQERFYATGKIRGGRFMKREGRPSDNAVLNGRLTDRPMRPLFPKGMINDVQVVLTILSADEQTDLGALAITASSLAVMKAGIPFSGPCAGIRIGYVDGKLKANTTNDETDHGDLDLVVAGTAEAILMVEAGANQVPEETMLEALKLAHDTIKDLCRVQSEFLAKCTIESKEALLVYNVPADEVVTEVKAFIESENILASMYVKTKHELNIAENGLKEKVMENFKARIEDEEQKEWTAKKVEMAIFKVLKKEVRKRILEKEERLDGRKLNEIRPLSSEVGLLPRTHGSALFTRGDTQSLSVVTLGAPGDAQTVDEMEGAEYERRYMHHYNMPPFATGEARPMRGTGRREVGHGYLGERAILPVLPDEKDFAYTIRVVSEIVTCNGSTSQAATCGSCLALMDAGVPLKAPVSGIAMGLVIDEASGNFKILSDIQGMEDFTGDMDFKVAGTKDGITALQMDIKVKGITIEIMRSALAQAHEGRAHILSSMLATIAEPKKELSPFAPKLITMQIKPDQIREVIGSGGKVINEITKETGVKIDISDDGFITITAPDQESGNQAYEWIRRITYTPEVGAELEGQIVRITTFGAFVEIPGGKDGLIHISNLMPFRVNRVEDHFKEGDMVKVKVIGIGDDGKIALSHKEYETRQQ